MIDLEELKKEDNWQKMIFEEQKVKHNVELKIFDFTQPDFEQKFKEYKEWLHNCFYNEDNWRTEVLSNDKGEPYLVYLEEGEHTLTVTSMLGDYKPMTDIFYEDAQKLSDLLLEIRKICSRSFSRDTNYY